MYVCMYVIVAQVWRSSVVLLYHVFDDVAYFNPISIVFYMKLLLIIHSIIHSGISLDDS